MALLGMAISVALWGVVDAAPSGIFELAAFLLAVCGSLAMPAGALLDGGAGASKGYREVTQAGIALFGVYIAAFAICGLIAFTYLEGELESVRFTFGESQAILAFTGHIPQVWGSLAAVSGLILSFGAAVRLTGGR